MKHKDVMQRLEAELQKHPEIEYEFARTKRHRKLVLRARGRERSSVFSGTSIDYRAVRNAVTTLRHNIRELLS